MSIESAANTLANVIMFVLGFFVLLFAIKLVFSNNNVPEKKAQWWIANSSFTTCHESSGPAAKLDEFVGFTDKPNAQDFRDSSGKIEKVEVTNSAGAGYETVWIYYKEKALCEAEQINSTKLLADKYR